MNTAFQTTKEIWTLTYRVAGHKMKKLGRPLTPTEKSEMIKHIIHAYSLNDTEDVCNAIATGIEWIKSEIF